MALYKEINITEAGESLILKQIIAGTEPLNFTAIAIGDGELAEGADTKTLTALVSEKTRLTVETFSQTGVNLYITARLSTDSISEGIYHREIGVYVGNTLFAYGNTGSEYDYIPPAGENAAVSKTIRLMLKVGSAKVQFTDLETDELVTHEALEQRIHKFKVDTMLDAANADIVYNISDMFKGEGMGENGDLWTLNYCVPRLKTYLETTGQGDKFKAGLKLKFKRASDGVYQTYIFNGGAWNDFSGSWAYEVTSKELSGAGQATTQTVQYGDDAAKGIVWQSAELIAPPHGRLKSITVASAASASEGLSTEPLYLLLLDYDDNILAASSNTVTPAAGVDATWTFGGVTLPKLKHVFLAVSTTADTVTAGAAGGMYSSEYTLGTRIYKAAGGGQYGTLKAAFCTEWTLEEHLNDTETKTHIYTEFSDLLTDGYSAPCLEAMCANMPTGSRAQIAIEGFMSGEDAPLNQDGILEISKAADLAKITFTAAPNNGEAIYNPEAIYINTCSSSGLGTWKKIALADVE